MKIICVTGAPGSDVNKVADIFFAAGVQPALPLRQDPSFTLTGWHEKVIAAAGGDRMPTSPVKQPGRFWEQFATNLFMENMHQPLWGWGDARSVWLLDFWQQFEPNLHFVLVYTSPQRALAEALAAEREHGADTATLMAAWEAHQTEILRFHHRNPDRTILVDAAECGAAPDALIAACTARWDLELVPSTTALPALPAPAPLVGYLAEQLRLTHPGLQVLQQELESSLQVLQSEPADHAEGPDLFAAVENYRQVRNAAARTDVLALEVEVLSDQLAQATNSASKLAGEKSEIERAVAQLKQTIAQRDSEVSALKADNAEALVESEQMLLQMHQLQEELERSFSENKKLSEIKTTKKRTIDELSRKVAQSEESLAALKKEVDAAKANKIAEKEKADALAALATAKRTIDELNKKVTQYDTSVVTLKKELAAARQGSEKLHSEQRNVKEAQQENELLLVQLHQVQEELEHYFLEYKTAVKQIDELSLRWQRMLERNPDYCDYQSLELLDIDQAGELTSWRFTELNAAGQAYAELRFKAIIMENIASIVFEYEDKESGMSNALDTMTTAEWTLLPTLCRILNDALQASTGSVARLDEAQRIALRHALNGLLETIAALPAAMRFDRIALKREQVNPDYEHLWLQLSNLSLGDKRWSDIDFRLSCANVRPGKFGGHPKLEFPSESGAILLGSWFAESFDDFGDKLELRFALPEAMDMSVWEKLAPADREVLAALTDTLPLMLSRLDHGQVRLNRNISEWQQLATDTKNIFATRTGMVAPPSVLANNVPALPQGGVVTMTGAIQKGVI